MKINKQGWGFRMMLLLMGILIFALLVAIYYIYNYYDKIINTFNTEMKVVDKIWKKIWY